MSTVKVLVIADKASQQAGIANVEWMSQHIYGYNFEFFNTSINEEAIQIALEKQPSIILVERITFLQDAYNIIHELKNNLHLQTIPVIGIGAKQNAQIYFDWGYDYFICKWPLIHQHLIRFMGELSGATYKELPDENYRFSNRIYSRVLKKHQIFQKLYRKLFWRKSS